MNAVKTIYYLFYLALIVMAGCKPADFTLSTPTTAPGAFQHDAFMNVSCVQCHENKRPISTPPHGNGQDCINCHSAHLNAQGVRTWLNLSNFDHNPLPTSCNQCHEGNRPNGVGGKPSIMPHLAGQWGATQDCASCHIFNQWKGKQANGADFVHFDHNKQLTTCKECHNSATRDDRPNPTNSTLVETTSPYHPQAYFDFNKALFTGFSDGTIPTLAPNGSTIGLTTDQSGMLNRINSKTFVAADQLECNTCHQNQTNDRVWSLTNASPTKSLFFQYDPTTYAVNQHLMVNPTTGATSEPTQCFTCHEINRPLTHINLDSNKSVIVAGMNTGDCKGCHVYSRDANNKPAPVIADWSNPVAFTHETALPVTCMDCHSNSIPLNQRGTLLSKPTHPVATGTYYAIDCIKCHTYDATLTPPFATAPARSWKNIVLDYRTHLKADGVNGPDSCLVCHKISNNSLPAPAINPSHTAGSRSNLDCKSCHVFNPTTKWYTFVTLFDHTKLDTVGAADRCDSCHKDSTMNLTTIKNPLTNIPSLATRAVNPVIHIPVPTISGNPVDCNTCHSNTSNNNNDPTTAWKTNVNYIHASTDTCSSCHNLANPNNIGLPTASFVQQKGSNHFPIGSMECSVCHTQANTNNYTTFLNSVFSHTNTNGNSCSTCHNDTTYSGTVAKQLPLPQGTNHLVLPQGSDCNTCHTSTTIFTGMAGAAINVTYNHNLAIDVDCNSCHVNHTGFAKGTLAAPSAHMTIPMIVLNGSTTTNPVQCSTCHKEVSVNGAALNIRTSPDFKIHTTANTQISTSASADTRCNVCHDGVNATGKTIAGFVPSANYSSHPAITGLQCVACHTASLSTTPKYKDFTGGGFIHTTALTNNNTTCNTCHSGSGAIATQTTAFAGHVPSTAECVYCHNASLTSFTNFSSGNYPHSDGVACTTCHDNTAITSVTQKSTSATGTIVHAGTTAACNTCHSNTATFTTWKIHTNATTTTDTSCNSCHTGLANTYGKQTTAYSGHVGIGTSQCISCHTNTLNETPKYLDFKGGVYTHTGTETCSTCHNNPSVNVTQPTTSVIHSTNATATCNSCHTNTETYTTWKIHTNAATGNKTSCNTCHMTTGVPLVLKNISTSASFTHFGITKTVGATQAECATCHQASMTVTTAWPSFTASKFSGGAFHTNATNAGIAPANNCTSCHTSAYSTAVATVMRILPITTGTSPQHLTLPIPTSPVGNTFATQCDSCHKDATFTSWKGMTLSNPTSTNVQYAHNLNATTDANCSACHTGATPGFAEGTSWYKNAAGASIHMSTTAQCSTCHQGADAGGTLTIKYTDFVVHSDLSTQTDTRCNVCHDGAGATGKTTAAFVATTANPTHPALAGNQCVTCHKTSLGTTPKYATFAGGTNHTATSTNNWTSCNTCHLSAGGTIQNFNNSPGYVHFSTVNNVGANVECAVCHSVSIGANPPTTGFANWSGGKFHLNVAASAITATTCANCHNNGLTYGTSTFRTLPAAGHLTLKAPIGSSTNAECSVCHTVTNNVAPATPNQWAGMAIAHSINAAVPLNVTYTHNVADGGNCVTCHTGATGFAEGISTVGLFTTNASVGADTHLTLPQSNGVNVNCDSCHNIFTASGAVWKGMAVKNGAVGLNTPITVTYNHLTMGTATCGSCHFDASVNGLSTPHARAVGTNYAIKSPYTASPVAHIGTAGSDCKACHQVAINGGATTTLPTNITMLPYQSFIGGIKQDHTSMTTNCLSCHWSGNGSTGNWVNADSTTASNSSFKHIDITSGTTVVQCSVCHVASMVPNGSGGFTGTSFAGGKFHAYQTASGLSATTCATCHNSSTYTYESTVGVFRKLPAGAGHLPIVAGTGVTANAQCSTCHAVTNNSTTATNSWNGTTFENKYNSAIPINVTYTHAAGDTTCNTCHSTNTATYKNKTGFATGYSNTTVHTSASVYPTNIATLQCGTCHVTVATNGTTTAKTTPDFIVHSASNTSSDTKCNACHLSGSAITKFNNYSNTGFSHFPFPSGTSSAECATCHQASITVTAPAVKYGSFAGGLFHSNTLNSNVSTSACASCHVPSGTSFTNVTSIPSLTQHLPLPVSALPAGNTTPTDCSTCHVSTNWHGTTYNNAGSVNVNYAHNINTTTDASCSTCHDITKQVTGATPLNKGYATGKTSTVTVHGAVAGAQQCSVCHMIVTGTGASSVASTKNTTDFKIHDSTNITTSKNRCNVCHMNTATSSATVASIKFYDAAGTYTHFPTKTTATTATFAECSICHSTVLGGSSAPYVTTYSFAGGKFHSNVTATSISATTCANCHNSASYTYEKVAGTFRKLATTHLPLTATTGVTANAECSVCHKVTNDSGTAANLWKGMALANAASPTTVALNVTYNHKAGDTACTTCHQGTTGYSEGNLSAGNGHLTIPLAPLSTTAKAECSACHIVGTTGGATTLDSWKSWRATTPQVVYTSHNTAATATCSACHTNAAGYAKGTATDVNHPANTAAIGECNKCHSYSTAPNVTTGVTAYTSFSNPAPQDHRAASDCLSCHYNATTGAVKNINANPTYNHFPILNNTLAPVQCSTCHAASLTTFTNFTGGLFHSTSATSAITTSTCTSCHNASYSYGTTVFRGLPTVGTAHLNPSQPNLATPAANIGRGECSTCHTVDNTATPATANTWKGMLSAAANPVKVAYTHSATNDTNCLACHSAGGLTKSGFATGYTSNSFHSTTVTAQCSTCHMSGTSTGTTPVAKFTPDFKVHTLTDTNNGTSCNACHLSSANAIQNNAIRSPGYKHFAYVNGSTYAECATCHTSSVSSTTAYPVINLTTGTFAGGLLHSKVPVSGISTTACSTCHNNSANVTNGTTSFKVMPASGTGHLNPTIGTAAAPATSIVRGECSICHAVDNTATPASANSWNGTVAEAANPVKVTYAHVTANDTNCNACHSLGATTKVGFATGYTSNSFHSTTVTAQCSTCHMSGTSTGAAPVTKMPVTGNMSVDFKVHTLADTTNGTKCNACHLSSANAIQNNAIRSPGYKHFPYVNGSTYAECATCHTTTVASTTAYPVINLTTGTFAGGLLHSKATASGISTTACSTCHNNPTLVTNGTTVFRGLPTVGTAHLNPLQPNLAATGTNINRGECSICHAVDNSVAPASANSWNGTLAEAANPIKVSYAHVIANDTNCNACHSNGLVTQKGFATGYTSNVYHSTTVTAQCSTCHLDGTVTTPTTPVAKIPVAANVATLNFKVHTLTDTSNGTTCNQCHLTSTNAIQFNTVYSAGYKHFPYNNGTNYAQCAVCHQLSINSKVANPVVTTTNKFASGSFHPNATTTGTTVTANCNSCHVSTNSTTLTSFKAVTATHLAVPTGANCDSCHNINTAASPALTWTGMPLKPNASAVTTVTYTHPATMSVTCTSCHAGTSTSSGLAEGPLNLPTATHLTIPTGADCNTCHSITTAAGAVWTGMSINNPTTTTISYNHALIPTGTSCNSCHYDGTITGHTSTLPIPRGQATGTPYAKLSSNYNNNLTAHMATGGSDCISCHNNSTAPFTYNAVIYPAYSSFVGGQGSDHHLPNTIVAGQTTPANCLSCHWTGNTATNAGTFANASSTANGFVHISIVDPAGTNNKPLQCSICHQASMIPNAAGTAFAPVTNVGFAGGKLHANATASGLLATMTCTSCHNNASVTSGFNSGANFKQLPTVGTNHLDPNQANIAGTAGSRQCGQCHTVANDTVNVPNAFKTWNIASRTINTASSNATTVYIATGTVGSAITINTLTNHGYTIGTKVVFSTTGALPTGITAGTTYYIQAVPTTSTFTVSATSGGAVINFASSYTQSGTHTVTFTPVLTIANPTFATATIQPAVLTTTIPVPATANTAFTPTYPTILTTTFTNPAAKTLTGTITTAGVFTATSHGLVVGMPIKFSASLSGTGFTVTAGTTYYVLTAPTTSTFTIAATSGGTLMKPTAAVTASGTVTAQATVITTSAAHGYAVGSQVWLSSTAAGGLPTGITTDVPYFVTAAPTTTTLLISSTSGGTPIAGTTTATGTNTITAYTAAVITTSTAHGFSVGSSIIFGTNKTTLPGSVAIGTTYFVTSVPTTTTFTFSTTPTGSNYILTPVQGSTGATLTVMLGYPQTVFTTASAHGYAAGDSVALDTTGALPAPFIDGATYTISTVPSTTTFTLNDSLGNPVSVPNGATQSGTQYVYKLGVPITITATTTGISVGDPIYLGGSATTAVLPFSLIKGAFFVTSINGSVMGIATTPGGAPISSVVENATPTGTYVINAPTLVTVPNHGIAPGDGVSFAITTGAVLPTKITSGTSYLAYSVPSNSQFKILVPSTAASTAGTGASGYTGTLTNRVVNIAHNTATDDNCMMCHTNNPGFSFGKAGYVSATSTPLHITTTANCSTCHQIGSISPATTLYTSFAGGTYHHTNTSIPYDPQSSTVLYQYHEQENVCSNCHNNLSTLPPSATTVKWENTFTSATASLTIKGTCLGCHVSAYKNHHDSAFTATSTTFSVSGGDGGGNMCNSCHGTHNYNPAKSKAQGFKYTPTTVP